MDVTHFSTHFIPGGAYKFNKRALSRFLSSVGFSFSKQKRGQNHLDKLLHRGREEELRKIHCLA